MPVVETIVVSVGVTVTAITIGNAVERRRARRAKAGLRGEFTSPSSGEASSHVTTGQTRNKVRKFFRLKPKDFSDPLPKYVDPRQNIPDLAADFIHHRSKDVIVLENEDAVREFLFPHGPPPAAADAPPEGGQVGENTTSQELVLYNVDEERSNPQQ